MQVETGTVAVVEETYGSTSYRRRFVRNTAGKILVFKSDERFQSVSHFFRTVFLPQGYPESVSGDYLVYQLWDTIQAFASSITGTLAAQALLKGVGVGDESATVLAATLTWLLKDGTGMVGRIMFAWLQGSNLDCDAKRWRLFADILNDIAIFLEILAPSFQSMFTVTVCVAGVLKSIVGVAGGATRAALTQHQARRNNMADVSAKDGSQETLVNLGALLCSLMLVPIITGKTMLIWTLYVMFTCLHLYANYSAVTSVVMESINQSRLHIILQHYFNTGNILPTKLVNYREPVLWKTRRKLEFRLGSSFQTLCKSCDDIENLRGVYTGNYILYLDRSKDEISICLLREAEVWDQLQACYQAELLEFICKNKFKIRNKDLQLLVNAFDQGDVLHLLSLSYRYTQDTFDLFTDAVHKSGWRTDVSLLGADEWRLNFDPSDLSSVKKNF